MMERSIYKKKKRNTSMLFRVCLMKNIQRSKLVATEKRYITFIT